MKVEMSKWKGAVAVDGDGRTAVDETGVGARLPPWSSGISPPSAMDASAPGEIREFF